MTGHGAGPHRTVAHERGSLTLEAALTLPVMALLAAGLLQLTGIATDMIAVREAAAVGARAASATPDPAAATAAVMAVLGDGRDATVTVSPTRPTAGQLVHVRVSLQSRLGPLRPTVVADAAAYGEPVLGRG